MSGGAAVSERNPALTTHLRTLLTTASAASWRPLLSERVHLRLCNRVCVIGIDDTMAELGFLFGNVAAVGADFLDISSLPLGALVETDLTPRRKALSHLLIPCVMIVHQDKLGGLVDIRVYFDPASIFAPPLPGSARGARSRTVSSSDT